MLETSHILSKVQKKKREKEKWGEAHAYEGLGHMCESKSNSTCYWLSLNQGLKTQCQSSCQLGLSQVGAIRVGLRWTIMAMPALIHLKEIQKLRKKVTMKKSRYYRDDDVARM